MWDVFLLNDAVKTLTQLLAFNLFLTEIIDHCQTTFDWCIIYEQQITFVLLENDFFFPCVIKLKFNEQLSKNTENEESKTFFLQKNQNYSGSYD